MFPELKTKTKEGTEEDEEEEETNTTLEDLIVYPLRILTSVEGASNCNLYGFQFGKMKSNKWVMSMLVSFG